MVMNVTSVAATPAATGDYISPMVKVIMLRPEGELCSSLQTIQNESFKVGLDSDYEI